MANAFTTLQTVFKTYLKKQKHFEEKSQTHVVIYSGVLPVESNSELDELMSFRYAFETQQFDSIATHVATAETTAMAKYRLLFNASFAKAMKIFFY